MSLRPNAYARPRRLAQSGLSLIELLIAMLIGMFLIVVVVTLVINMGRNFKTQDQVSQIDDAERFMLTVLNNTVHVAGYFADPTSGDPNKIFVNAGTPDGSALVAGQFVSGTKGAGTASDTLNVRVQAGSNDGLTNCQGDSNPGAAPVIWINSFAVNASGQLTCTVTADGSVGAPTVLVDNVSSVKILYGVDTDADGSVDTYLDAAGVTAGTNTKTPNFWLAVGSVRLSITLRDTLHSTPTVNKDMPTPIVHTITLMNHS